MGMDLFIKKCIVYQSTSITFWLDRNVVSRCLGNTAWNNATKHECWIGFGGMIASGLSLFLRTSPVLQQMAKFFKDKCTCYLQLVRLVVAGWLVGWLLGWLVGWLLACLLACLLGWLVGWLVGSHYISHAHDGPALLEGIHLGCFKKKICEWFG